MKASRYIWTQEEITITAPAKGLKYSDDQPRDESGRWTAGDGGATAGDLHWHGDTQHAHDNGDLSHGHPFLGNQYGRNFENSLGLRRIEMPQIDAKDYDEFLTFMAAHGCDHENEMVPTTTLKPAQRQWQPRGVEAIAHTDGMDKPLLVSKDDYVLDGTHRWVAAQELGIELVPAIRLDMPAREAINLMNTFPKVSHADSQFHPSEAQAGAAGKWFWGKALKWPTGIVTRSNTPVTIVFHKWDEDAHPRGDGGRFTSGGEGSSTGAGWHVLAGATPEGLKAERVMGQHFDTVSAEQACNSTDYFRGAIGQSGAIYSFAKEQAVRPGGNVAEDDSGQTHGDVYTAISSETGLSPEKMGFQSITNEGELGGGKDRMMVAVGGPLTAPQLSTIRELFSFNHQMPYDLYDRNWLEARSGEGATQFNAHLRELGFIEGGKGLKYSDDEQRDHTGRWTSGGDSVERGPGHGAGETHFGKTTTAVGEMGEALFAKKVGPRLAERFGGPLERLSHAEEGGGRRGPRNTPLDFRAGSTGIEVKTLSSKSENLKVAMKAEEIARKEQAAHDLGLKHLSTVALVINASKGTMEAYAIDGLRSVGVASMEHLGTYKV